MNKEDELCLIRTMLSKNFGNRRHHSHTSSFGNPHILLPRSISTFPEATLDLSSGNFSSHLKRLHETGYVEVSKRFVDLKPTTIVSIALEGKKAIDDYAHYLRNLLQHIEADD